ncbi:MAG TPA: response regulator transcription factor [Gemmatimonadales bacterium]|jgi:DNA-binding NarL/FixJ family response regulator|nr:response regulator transcription factor [Gemmatimonadales bacterium]
MSAPALSWHNAPPERWPSSHSRPSVGRPRLLLADDHDLILAALHHLLEREFTVLRGVTDGEALVAAALELRPDVVLCDVTMPRLSGFQATQQVRQRLPQVRFIFLTMHDDPELAAEAFRAGASAYILKSAPPSELLHAIRTVVVGGSCPPKVQAQAERPAPTRRITDVCEPENLSPREREVVRLVAGGRTMKEAAAALGITPRTVAFHKYRIMRQLSMRSSAELVQFAVKRRLI